MYSLMDTWGFPCEFPHSEIFGSLAMCAYPKLIAAYHVLHRLLMPRHSPCALCSLTYCHDISFKTKFTKNISWLCCINILYIMCNFQRTSRLQMQSFTLKDLVLKIEQKVKFRPSFSNLY